MSARPFVMTALPVAIGLVAAGCTVSPMSASDEPASAATTETSEPVAEAGRAEPASDASTPRAALGGPTGATAATSRATATLEEADALRPTLAEALALADAQHPAIEAAAAAVDVAAGRAEQAGLLPNPELTLRMESARLSGKTTGEAEYLAGVRQELPIGGRLGAAEHAGLLEAAARTAELRRVRFVVHGRVRGAFATALFFEKVTAAREEAVEAARSGLELTRSRLELGDAVPSDVALAEVEALRAERDRDRDAARRRGAVGQLAFALGDGSLALEGVRGDLDDALGVPALEEVVARLESHPAVAASRANEAAADARIDAVLAARIPDVSLELLYRRIEEKADNAIDVGIGVELPIFDRRQGAVRAAWAEAAGARARTRETRLRTARAVHAAHIRLRQALADAGWLAEEILPRLEVVLEAAEVRYAAGDVALGEVIRQRSRLTESRLARLTALRDAMAAWAEIAPLITSADG